ncbi:MAG TPA: hypothetical protein VNU72_04405, partial [Puia sp.]|nr:hypothetical protein [Puia sp.]
MRAVFIVAGCLLQSLMTGAQPHNAAPPAGPANSARTLSALVSATNIIPDGNIHMEAGKILTGADQMDKYVPLLEGKSVAVFANATSMVGQSHLVDTLLKKGIHI